MWTVRELSRRTGVSVRTLHYYDEVGLLPPTGKSEAGYRLYDETALERLRQILLFREFDLPLKDIRAVLENPALNREELLRMQRELLTAKKARLERLIAGIDRILGGDAMDFSLFSREEIDGLFQLMLRQMPAELRQTALAEFGGQEQWKQHYVEAVSWPEMQQNYAKVAEWYGGKDAYLSAAAHPLPRAVAGSWQKREEAVREKLLSRRESGVDSFPAREAAAEYGFVMKQLCQVQKEDGVMRSLARSYRDPLVRARVDGQYGDGASEFLARAIKAFYGQSYKASPEH